MSIRYSLLVILFMLFIDENLFQFQIEIQYFNLILQIVYFISSIFLFKQTILTRKARMLKLEKQSIPKLKNISPTYSSGIERLKTTLAYNRYLQYLRNNGNNKTEPNKKTTEPQQKSRFHLVSKQIMGKVFGKNQRTQKCSQIKASNQISQEALTQQMLKISNKMDAHLENKLNIPLIELNTENKEQKKKEQVLSFDLELINLMEEKKFQTQGVPLNLLHVNFSNRIKSFISNDQNNSPQQSKRKHEDILQFEANTSNHTRHKGTKSEYKFITNIEENYQLSQNKQNIKNKINSNSLIKEQKRKMNKLRINQSNLMNIFNRYHEELQKYGNENIYMTQKRREAIFVNEIVKLNRKYHSIEILPTIWQQKQDIRKDEEQKKLKVQKYKKLTNKQLKQKCKQSFQYITDLDVQKL